MIKRSYLLYLEDILDAMSKIMIYSEGIGYDDFVENTMLNEAVIRNLEIIGEASKNMPQNLRKQYPDISWKSMIGLRNIMIHEYFGVDLTIVWQIVTKNIPETKPMIEEMVKQIEMTENDFTKG